MIIKEYLNFEMNIYVYMFIKVIYHMWNIKYNFFSQINIIFMYYFLLFFNFSKSQVTQWSFILMKKKPVSAIFVFNKIIHKSLSLYYWVYIDTSNRDL